MNRQTKQFYEFGPFRVDSTERLLFREGRVVPLTPKVFDTLLVFVENGGRILSKEEIMKIVWPDTTVEEANLTRNVSVLRKTLSAPPDQSQYIETIPWRGYRFVASVREVWDKTEEECSPHTVVIDHEISEPVLRAKLAPVLPDNSLASDYRKKARRRWLAAPIATAGGALLGAVLLAVSFLWTRCGSMSPTADSAIESIAVLPFKSLNPEAGDEYLAVGMADALVCRLSQSKRIIARPFCAGRQSAYREADPLTIGRKLRVDAALSGSIHNSEGRIRIAARLINTRDGALLWSGSFDEKSEDIFALQDSMVKKLAAALMLKPTAEEERRFIQRHTASADAYHAYLKGRFWWNKRSSEGFQRAIEFYNEAIALDRNYALAYAGLADCYLLMSPYGLARPKESYPKARAAATQALALDNQLAEVHASLAHLTWLYDWNFQEAEAEFKQAILLDPNYPTAHQWYSVYLSSMGRHDEAIAKAKLARELDPLSLSILQDLSRAYYHAGRYDEAIATSFEALDLSPQFCQVNSWLELSYAQKGVYDKSIEARLNSLKMTGTAPAVVASLRHSYTVSGWKGYWRKALELEMAKPSRNPVFPYLIARIYARLGEHDQALQWLEKAYQERLDHMVLLKVDPIFKPLQSDPQFNALLRRVGFEDKPGSVGKMVK